MSINRITKQEFERFNPNRHPMAAVLATEEAWYVDTKRNLIGAVLLDHTDKDWNYVILGRDERGSFRWIDGESSLDSRESAERELSAAMSKLEASGEEIFPQGD